MCISSAALELLQVLRLRRCREAGDLFRPRQELGCAAIAAALMTPPLAKLAVLGGNHRGSEDGDNVAASDCSDMSDVSDIFPSIAVGAGDEDSDEED